MSGKRKIILASTSPRRREILLKAGLTFEIVTSDYEEDMSQPLPPAELVKNLSAGKASSVAARHRDAVVIGADTVVVLNGEILGKPKTPERAKEMLKKLSGRAHSVFTGFAVRCDADGKCAVEAVETKVHFRKLSDRDIEEYVASGEPLDKAGAYGIQGLAAAFIERIEGDYHNVVGLPLEALLRVLKKFGIEL